jgi:enoyl-CoA hydratase/methylglutaconyl-CoA hydratase
MTLVHYDVEGAVAHLILDSPHNRNALSRQLAAELAAGLDRAEADQAAKVIVLRSAGEVFCSGADLSEVSSATLPEEGPRMLIALTRRIAAHDKPVVAAVRGAVRAGGVGLVGAADIAIASPDANFALTEVRLGLAPAAISLVLLPRLTPRSASRTFLTGERFDAAAALASGLVTEVADDLDGAVARVTADLCKAHPQGLRETKRLLNAALIRHLDDHAGEMTALSGRLFGSDGAREAMTAFLNRRNDSRDAPR